LLISAVLIQHLIILLLMSFFDLMIYRIFGICFALCSCNRSEEASGRDRFRSVSDRQALSEGKSVPSGSHDAMLQSPDFPRESSRAQNAYHLTGEWDGLSREFSGEELLKQQKELALRAVGELGAGPELLEFLDCLAERGAKDGGSLFRSGGCGGAGVAVDGGG
jgi:hypothetical protein